MTVRKSLLVLLTVSGCAMAQIRIITPVQRLTFDSPEAWALKYFTSMTLLSGLQPEPLGEERNTGSVTAGLELGWMPRLNAERASVGFSGRKQEDINKTPIFVRPMVRVGLPWRFSLVAAAPAPFDAFGVTPHLFALGIERPIFERPQWRFGWRVHGQVGSADAAFTCPHKVLGLPAGSPGNPSGCTAESADTATLRYAGAELQFAHRMPGLPKLTPHVSAGANLIHSAFQVNAPLGNRLDRTRLWTRGITYSGTAGASYAVTKRMVISVDAFYTPLAIRRTATSPRVNDGLFNVRALLSYNLR